MTLLRKATESDFGDLITLYSSSVSCSRTQAAAEIRNLIGIDNFLVLEKEPVEADGPSIGAMLAAVPVTAGYRNGLWFTGMATREDLRGKGIMTKLIDTCLRAYAQNGYFFALVVPESPAAAQYYENLHFQNAFQLRVVRKPIQPNLLAQAEFDTMTVRRFCETRKRYQPGCVTLPESSMTEIMTRLYTQGVTTVINQRGYGLYYVKGDVLQFIELQADNDHAADLLLQAAREKTGATQAHVILAESQNLYMGEGKRCGYAMIRFLKKPFPLSNVYFRLLL